MLVYIDETGDHNLTKIDSQYPIFGLGAFLITESEYLKLDKELTLIKKEFFNDDGTFILHSSELKRPLDKRSDERNKIMLNPDKRKKFYKAINERIIKSINFHVVLCFILKARMVERYIYPVDPYYFSYENLLNRIIRYGDSMNAIYAEKRGSELDIELTSEHDRLTKVGIHSYKAETVSSRTNLKLINKSQNINGLQIIDLILSCVARAGLGKKEKMIGNDLDPDLVKKKFACPYTVFPKKKNG
jgi:hypothetical protein